MGVTRVRHKRSPLQPVPYTIEGKDWNSPIIRYKCPKCDTTFDSYGSSEHFCHGCGRKLNWNRLLEKIDSTTWQELVEMFDNETIIAEIEFLKTLNKVYRDFGITKDESAIEILKENEDDT